MAKNNNLHKAKSEPNNEFYTQLSDIEKELRHYKDHFKGKSVFLNCDDPEESHFWKYFSLNFEFLGLTRLVSTHFEIDKPSYKLEIRADMNGDGIINRNDMEKVPLYGNGDFRSPEAIEILKECDIVCTNPPFSLFREYLAQLEEYKKDFLIVGSMNAVTYKETFKLIKDNNLWKGVTEPKQFREPDGGVKDFGNICWFTNLTHPKRNDKLILTKEYDPLFHLKYDNYDAINCDKVKDIPKDYKGCIGVPITFLDKWNPGQFEILGLANSARWIGYKCLTIINGSKIYNRLLIKHIPQ